MALEWLKKKLGFKTRINIDLLSGYSEEYQIYVCKELNPYEDWDLFKDVKARFISEYGDNKDILKISCGFGAGLGPYYGIFVTIKKGSPRIKLPKYYLGFRVFRKRI